MATIPDSSREAPFVLVTGATGKVGSRIAARLEQQHVPFRAASRGSDTHFDWHQPETWPAALSDVRAAFLCYAPDVGFPGADATIGAFARRALDSGVERLVLLSGRGEPGAVRSEDALRHVYSGSTVLRCAWFSQNFSEHFLRDAVLEGTIALPAGDVAEPFVDLDDIADVGVAALLSDGHEGQTYELTGPDLLTFADAAEIIASASGRRVDFVEVSSDDYVKGAISAGVSTEEANGLAELFETVLDGRNESTSDDLPRLLGHPAGTFVEFARRAAATGVWRSAEPAGLR